jgi:2-polyprenyl-3-methyl-5-hydroxy-6-metoxy-1,4-benzoquinol methylase
MSDEAALIQPVEGTLGERQQSIPLPKDYLLSEESENIWGYAKRVRFMASSIREAFPNRTPASIRVLDIGCGNGSCVAIPLARLGFNVTGVDPHAPSIERAVELAEGIHNIHFVTGYVQHLSHPPFDVILLSEVLEHLSDPSVLLCAALQHLREGGIVIVTVPNGYGEFEIDWWIFRKLHLEALVDLARRLRGPKKHTSRVSDSIASSENQNSPHIQFFTRQSIRRVFDRCSLQVIRERNASFLCGAMVVYALGRSDCFARWNARISDRLPPALASGWYFVLRPSKGTGTPNG